MGATEDRPARRQMRVLLTASRSAANWEPWGRNLVEALSRSHDVVLVDSARPLVEQVADSTIDAVADPNFLASPELAAAGAGHVRLWQLGSVGYDKVDVASLAAHGIPAANCPGFTSSRSLAEQALMLAMMVMRSYPALAASVEAGKLGGPIGRQLAGRTLLIIGFGSSGRELARRAVAFGMTVLAIGHRDPDPELARRYGIDWLGGPGQLDWALARTDVVSLHVPLNTETRNILDARRLGLLRAGAVVVNVSRGGLSDEVALAALGRSGHLFGAGLDVVDGEPAGPDHPLRNVPQVIIAPHVAGATESTARRRARFAALNVSRVGYGLEPLNRVDLLPPQG